MSLENDDIDDFEIRVISSGNESDSQPPIEDCCELDETCPILNDGLEPLAFHKKPSLDMLTEELIDEQPKKRHKFPWVAILLILIGITGLIFFIGLLIPKAESSNNDMPQRENMVVREVEESEPAIVTQPQSSVLILDTIVNNKGLTIYEPRNATASLTLGDGLLSDSTIILATQAADVRGDNGEILGTFVLNGELKSKGESKAGFCAIINGQPTIGIADATPMLEQALTEGGYFFRQYPLVVGGQSIENKPKGRAVRKALAEIGNKICIIVSHDKLTFTEFSELLTEAGVRNAIYLCGGDSYGFYNDKEGQRQQIGNDQKSIGENISFIIWK
ncbi:MAG: phosphodiester glycosidase family protein [Muribaculaceae bacterium]|nr:phosphodiester glycosidase family protein [Muribaculaceae bacterium]